MVPATVAENPGEVALLADTPPVGPATGHKLIPVVDAAVHGTPLNVPRNPTAVTKNM